jgi:hypothetical protein
MYICILQTRYIIEQYLKKTEDVNMVTEYILSDMERHILRRYLEDNIKREDFIRLIHSLKRGFKRIKKINC